MEAMSHPQNFLLPSLENPQARRMNMENDIFLDETIQPHRFPYLI